MQFKLPLLFILFTLSGLYGCGGVSGENGSDPFGSGDTATSYSIKVDILNQQCESTGAQSFITGETLCIQATLFLNGESVSGEIISFTTGLGTLTAETKLTDSEGVAQIALSSDSGIVGASTVSASFAETLGELNFEFVTGEVGIPGVTPGINISMLLSGEVTNRFSSTQQVTVTASLSENSQLSLPNQVIRFSSDLGIFSPATVLTNEEGLAQTQFSANVGDLGADTITAQLIVNGTIISNDFVYQILSDDAIQSELVRIGHFDSAGQFVENELGVTTEDANGDVAISAGATLGVSVALVDQNEQRIITPTTVTFSSNCVQSGLATLDEQVNTINGEAFSTFEDVACAGSIGNNDVIVANLLANDQTLTVSRNIEILAENIGSIVFVSALPENITLAGTGGVGNSSVSILTFQVNGELGNPLAQQEVDFSLNTNTGGLSLSPLSGFTNSQGQISTRVNAGNVPTSVRVTATTSAQNGADIQTQSDLLTVNTGLPNQNGMTLSASLSNPEAFNISGVESTIIARLSDSFNNPVPDGTAVTFTTEGGTIAPSCITLAGTCSVIWTSSEPRPDDHAITILATAIGHETLFDSNGNNTYDDADGPAIPEPAESGLVRSNIQVTGFADMSEAWRDDNENGLRDSTEIFLDYDNDQQFDAADGVFNGPQCESANLCGQGLYQSLHIRKAIVMVMSGSNALWSIRSGATGSVVFSNDPNVTSTNELTIATGESDTLTLEFTDSAGQVMPANTLVAALDTDNALSAILYTVANRNQFDSAEIGHIVQLAQVDNTAGTVSNQLFTFVIETPSGTRTLVTFILNKS
jgi:hypothetical protein